MASRTCPSVSEVKEIIKRDKGEVFFDGDGRLYGYVKPNELTKEMEEHYEMGAVHMWVALLQKKKGLYQRKEKQVDDADDELTFPETNVDIQIHSMITKDQIGTVRIHDFPDLSGHGNQRTASIYATLTINF